MDGLTKTDELVFVLAATNLPWELDAAMLRRLEKRVSFLNNLVFQMLVDLQMCIHIATWFPVVFWMCELLNLFFWSINIYTEL